MVKSTGNGSPSSVGAAGRSRHVSAAPPSPQAQVRIIPEMFNEYNRIGEQQALSELDAALAENCPVIVIEPMNLGDRTSRWIRVGNGLHKTAVLGGFASSFGFWIGDPWTNNLRGVWYSLCGVVAAVSLSAYLTHTLSWQSDPCCSYQVETEPTVLTRLLKDANYYSGPEASSSSGSNLAIQSGSVVVLVRKEDRYRRYLQNTAAAVTVGVIGYRFLKCF